MSPSGKFRAAVNSDRGAPASSAQVMVLKNSMIYGIGALVQAVLAVATIALYTRLLGAQAYGEYAFVTTSVQFAYALAVNWLGVSTIRLYQRFKSDAEFLAAIVSFWGWAMAGALAASVCAALFLETGRQWRLLALGFLYFAAFSWMELQLRVLQARLEARKQTMARITRSILSALIGGALAWAGWGPSGILIGLIVGSVAPGLIESARMLKIARAARSSETRRQILAFGAPLAASFAIGTTTIYLGRFAITWFEGIAALGVYAVSYELANRVSAALLGPIASAAAPISARDLERGGEEEARRTLRKSCVLLFGLTAPAAVGMALISPELAETIIGAEFRQAAGGLLPLLALSLFATGFRMHYLDHAMHLGLKSKWLIWRSGIVLIFAGAANLVLIASHGVLGAAYAAAASSAFGLIVTALMSRSAFALPFPAAELVRIAAATAAMGAVVSAVPGEPGWAKLFVNTTTAVGAYAALVVALNIGGVRGRLRAAAGKAQRRLRGA